MKVELRNTMYHIAIYITSAAIIFTLVFAVIYHVAYNEMYFPHEKIRLNGAKNLLRELPVIEYAQDPAPDLENYQEEDIQGTPIQGEFVKKP